jgi:prepilin-type N-terminal cleavage/methylation domain-containing protein
MNPRRANAGFSLVELLVVVAVIAVLASLLLPALTRAWARARSAQCVGNLHQWGLAFRQYADDNKDFLPRRGQGVRPLDELARPEDWFNALPSYLRSLPYQQLFAANQKFKPGLNSVFVCPAAKDPGGAHFLPYAMNMNLCPWSLPQQTRFTEVVRPAQVVAMAEGPGPYASTFPSTNRYSPVVRHAGRVNLLFLAGQVNGYAGGYAGCGVGDPGREDLRWLTGTASDAAVCNY